MGLFNTLREQAQDISSQKDKYKNLPSSVKEAISKDKPPAQVIKEPVEKEEYRKRYNNLRVVSLVSAICSLVAFIMMPLSDSVFRLIFTLTAAAWFGMLYYRYAFRMWAARQAWLSWEKIMEERVYKQAEFIEDLSKDPSELLPKPLARD